MWIKDHVCRQFDCHVLGTNRGTYNKSLQELRMDPIRHPPCDPRKCLEGTTARQPSVGPGLTPAQSEHVCFLTDLREPDSFLCGRRGALGHALHEDGSPTCVLGGFSGREQKGCGLRYQCLRLGMENVLCLELFFLNYRRAECRAGERPRVSLRASCFLLEGNPVHTSEF